MSKKTSAELLFQRAIRVIPGGVNSPVRAFRAVGGNPLIISKGSGSHIWDVNDKEFIDYVCSWGPLLLGHAPSEVVTAICEAAANGTSFGATTEKEIEFAETLVRLVPCLEKVRLVNSGTEATMSALRLARGFTKRDLIVKVIGGYHGHADYLLVSAGSGAATFGVPSSAGVTAKNAVDTLVVPFNNLEAAHNLFAKQGDKIAAIIIEPVAGNMGVVLPQKDYLEGLRALTQKSGSLLIFDEVITGFRLGLGGAQQLFGISPDLTCLGKIIGGGLPVGAYGGRAEIMSHISPDGPVYQAGTLSGNPLAVTAGLVTLRILEKMDPYSSLEQKTLWLTNNIRNAAKKTGLPVTVNQIGSMFTTFFTSEPVIDYASAEKSDVSIFKLFHQKMLEQGIYFAPSQFEAAFLSVAHTKEDLERTAKATACVFEELTEKK